jgi:predicted lipoprotein with Yx(FWY)xxD motif
MISRTRASLLTTCLFLLLALAACSSVTAPKASTQQPTKATQNQTAYQTSPQMNQMQGNQSKNQGQMQKGQQKHKKGNGQQHNQGNGQQNQQYGNQNNGNQNNGGQNNGNQNNGGQNNGGQNNGGQNNGGKPTNIIVNVRQVTIQGQQVSVLTTFSGMTLYYSKADMPPNSNCTGSCAQTWMPLTTTGNVILATPFQGTISVHKTANGRQVEFNGSPLYTYVGDHAPGDVNGNGANNVWFPVVVILQRQHW